MEYKLQTLSVFLLLTVFFTSVKAENECCTDVTKEISLLRQEIQDLKKLGSAPYSAASSCHEIYEHDSSSLPEYYWIKRNPGETPVKVKCDFDVQLPPSQVKRGWIPIGNIYMSNPSQTCPGSLREIAASGGKRRCGKQSINQGCESVFFETHGVPFTKVCGRIRGYTTGSADAFRKWLCPTCGINEAYVDGISITYGGHPNRQHIWTLVAEQVHAYSRCPCGNRSLTSYEVAPSFVGNDLYCEVAADSNQLLWDGQGCTGTDVACCQNPNLPWFCREFDQAVTTDDIEVRLCLDEDRSNEDIEFESIELYIQ